MWGITASRRSIGIALAGLDDANEVIGELCVTSREFHLWHVAAYTIGFGYRAGFSDYAGRGGFAGSVARKAFCIVKGQIVIRGLVRIMAGDTTDPRIAADEAAAVFQAVGLEANEGGAMPFVTHHGVPGAMTLAAEVGDLLGVKMPE